MLLCKAGSVGSLLFPSSSGFLPNLLPLAFSLSAFRCVFPPSPSPPPPLPPPPALDVLIVADSMFRPFERLTWPSPYRVTMRSISGATLATVVRRCVSFSPSFRVVVIHAGVNDASRGSASLEHDFRAACESASGALVSRFPGARIAFSLACLSSSEPLNLKIAAVNSIVRDVSQAHGLAVISNDNIQFSDLTDTVHLNAVGTARLQRNVLDYLRVAAA